jgi:hypothetical protein
MITYHRYVNFHQVNDYLALGWLARSSLAGCHHSLRAVHMVFLCCCPLREPLDAQRRPQTLHP